MDGAFLSVGLRDKRYSHPSKASPEAVTRILIFLPCLLEDGRLDTSHDADGGVPHKDLVRGFAIRLQRVPVVQTQPVGAIGSFAAVSVHAPKEGGQLIWRD
jgi:hypothetical protein